MPHCVSGRPSFPCHCLETSDGRERNVVTSHVCRSFDQNVDFNQNKLCINVVRVMFYCCILSVIMACIPSTENFYTFSLLHTCVSV